MKALSLHQPYASAIFAGVKENETRSWRLPASLIGQPVAIQATKKWSIDQAMQFQRFVLGDFRYRSWKKFSEIGIQRFEDLPRGVVLGIVRFTACHLTDAADVRTFPDRPWGDFGRNRFYWPIEVIERFARPIPCVGKQGFFEWERPAA